MKYEFPRITHLDEVRAVIKDLPEFIIAERDWGFAVNYLVSGPDTFPGVHTAGGSLRMREEATRAKSIRRECRGLLFYPDGRIMSRRLHKFWNVNERDETQLHRIDLGQPHVILEKLDGSMVTPVFTDAGVRWGTKMGITDVSMQAELFVADHAQYEVMALECHDLGLTPIFEWCSRKQRIVVDYPEDRLVLIAMRDNITGDYVSYADLGQWTEKYGIELVRVYPGNTDSMENLLEETHGLKDQEGWIIRFEDGHMLKLKGDEYVTIHKAKDKILRENGVIEMLLADKLDDVKAVLDDDTRHSLEKFEAEFWQGVATSAEIWQTVNTVVRARHGTDRKAFALAPTTAVMDGNLKSAIFKSWDATDFDWRQAVLDTVAKNIGTQTRVDAVRGLWGGARWTYGSSAGDE